MFSAQELQGAHNAQYMQGEVLTMLCLVPKSYKAPKFIEELTTAVTEAGTVSLECKVRPRSHQLKKRTELIKFH